MHRYTHNTIHLALALVCLNGCAKENYNTACPCLPLIPYDTAFQDQLAEEIEHASPDAAFPLALQDYASLRAGLRVGCK
jgi:hypothetical protein